jgi:RNA polymerase sigma-70 factor (ECF subfamily)
MREVMSLLRPADQELLWLRHADQLSFADIAVLLQVSENAATVRYVRALRKLKALWLKLYPLTSESL